MRNNLKELKKIAKGVRLSSNEKSAMRGELLRYMEVHPIRDKNPLRALEASNGTNSTKIYHSIPSPFSINRFRNKKTMPILIILGLLIGGGTSFAAGNALPGDILYPIKVHLNETVHGAMYISPEAKAEWDVRLVERRIKEIEKIEAKPDVSLEVKEIAQANLVHYTERVNKHILKFEKNKDGENAIVVTEKFTEVLRAHETIINLKVQEEQNSDAPVAELFNAGSHSIEIQSKIKDLREKTEKKQKDLEKKYRTQSQKSGQENLGKDFRIK